MGDDAPTEREKSFANTKNTKTRDAVASPGENKGSTRTGVTDSFVMRHPALKRRRVENGGYDVIPEPTRLFVFTGPAASDLEFGPVAVSDNGKRKFKERDADGLEHYGENSAVYPPDVVLNEAGLFKEAPKVVSAKDLDPLLCDAERARAALDMPPTAAGAANFFYGSYNRRHMYGSVDGSGNKALNDVDTASLITVPVADVRVHPRLEPATPKLIDVTGDAALMDYLNPDKSTGDTRSLTGLLSVVFGNRDQINNVIRRYMLAGTTNSNSAHAYAKMWLYFFSVLQTTEQTIAGGDPAFGFNNAVGYVPVAVDDPELARANFDANEVGINNDTAGWFYAPRGVEEAVIESMADFFRPFPAYTTQNANYKPAAMINQMQGVNVVVANIPAYGVGARAPRVAPPTGSQILRAIELLAGFRNEESDAVVGYALAQLMASGGVLALPPAGGVAAELFVRQGLGPTNGLVRWKRPVSNTLASAFLAGPRGVALKRLSKLTQTIRAVHMRAIHTRVTVRAYCFERCLQILSLTGADIEDTFANVANQTRRDAVNCSLGSDSAYSDVVQRMFKSLLVRVFGVPVCDDVENIIWSKKENTPAVVNAPGFWWSRIQGRNAIPLTVSSYYVIGMKTCSGIPYFMECALSQGKIKSMHKEYDATGGTRLLRTCFTSSDFSGSSRYLTSNQFVELNLAMAAEPALPAPAFQIRRRTVLYGAGGAMAPGAPAAPYARDPANPGFMTLPVNILAMSWQPLAMHAYEYGVLGRASLPAQLHSDTIIPLGSMVDTSYDPSGIAPALPPQSIPGFFGADWNPGGPPAPGPGGADDAMPGE